MMKHLLALAMILSAFTSGAMAAEDSGTEAFASALRSAIAGKDAEELEALIYQEGGSPEDKQRMTAMLRSLYLNGKEVEAIRFEPLPRDFESVLIVQGKKIEPTSPPKGMVHVTFKGPGNGPANSSGAYAVVNGKYYLVGMKSTDLGWKGAPDRNIGFSVSGQGSSELQIHGVWNASGVELKKEFETSSLTFWGQHFEELTVTSVSDACDATVTISEGGKEIFSEALKGKGVVRYKK